MNLPPLVRTDLEQHLAALRVALDEATTAAADAVDRHEVLLDRVSAYEAALAADDALPVVSDQAPESAEVEAAMLYTLHAASDCTACATAQLRGEYTDLHDPILEPRLPGRWSNGDPVHLIVDGTDHGNLGTTGRVAPNLNGAVWVPAAHDAVPPAAGSGEPVYSSAEHGLTYAQDVRRMGGVL